MLPMGKERVQINYEAYGITDSDKNKTFFAIHLNIFWEECMYSREW